MLTGRGHRWPDVPRLNSSRGVAVSITAARRRTQQTRTWDEPYDEGRGYAASVLPQLAQNREAGASIPAPHVAQAPFRYFPQDEQNAGSGSGRGPHTSHDRRIARYRRIAASAGSTEPATTGAFAVDGVTAGSGAADSATDAPRRDRSSTNAERVYVALSAV